MNMITMYREDRLGSLQVCGVKRLKKLTQIIVKFFRYVFMDF